MCVRKDVAYNILILQNRIPVRLLVPFLENNLGSYQKESGETNNLESYKTLIYLMFITNYHVELLCHHSDFSKTYINLLKLIYQFKFIYIIHILILI